MTSLTFSKYFERYTNYHSFVDLLNLCKEVSDYIYNNDIINSQFFNSFKETKNGYEILFDKNEQKNYFIDSNKETVKDEKGDEQLIDSVYEDIETLYSIIRNDEILINIKQMDENMKTFDELMESLDYLNYDKIQDLLKNEGWGDVSSDRLEQFENSDYIKGPSNEIEYVKQMSDWLYKISKGELDEKVKSFKEMIKINEGFDDELGDKISGGYVSLKKGILSILDDHLKGDITKLQDFIDNYIDPESEEIIEGFVEPADIFSFYLKYQSDVDQILLDKDYYDDAPDVESLYDYVIDGTYDAVVYCMEEMKKDLYNE